MRQHGIVMLLGLAVSFGPALLAPPAARGDEGSAPTLSKDVQPIFDRSCVKCHGQKRQKAKLDLSAATARKALVDVPSTEVPQIVLLKPGDPAHSYLWQKLEHTSSEGKGMPRFLFWAKSLSDQELAVIRKWIEAGAPE
jgi:cytochrome c553